MWHANGPSGACCGLLCATGASWNSATPNPTVPREPLSPGCGLRQLGGCGLAELRTAASARGRRGARGTGRPVPQRACGPGAAPGCTMTRFGPQARVPRACAPIQAPWPHERCPDLLMQSQGACFCWSRDLLWYGRNRCAASGAGRGPELKQLAAGSPAVSMPLRLQGGPGTHRTARQRRRDLYEASGCGAGRKGGRERPQRRGPQHAARRVRV